MGGSGGVSVAPGGLLRLVLRRRHLPGALAQFVVRQALGVDHHAAGHQEGVVADLAKQVVVFRQRCQHQRQA